VVLQFDAAHLMRAGTVFPEVMEIVPLLNAWRRGFQYHGETAGQGAMLMEEIGKAHGFHRLVLFLELVRCLAQSSERTPLASADCVPSLDQDAPRIIQKVMSYILENLKDTVSLSEAAEIAGMSESSFSRFFKKNSGNNFVDYVRKLRISHACKILSETSIPVTEVCFEVGYNNISNFNRHFLMEKGITPSRYRRMSVRKFTAEASG
jgi:AraC-like DNA-binding protein